RVLRQPFRRCRPLHSGVPRNCRTLHDLRIDVHRFVLTLAEENRAHHPLASRKRLPDQKARMTCREEGPAGKSFRTAGLGTRIDDAPLTVRPAGSRLSPQILHNGPILQSAQVEAVTVAVLLLPA